MPLRLCVLSSGPRQGESISIRPTPFLIGRGAGCHLRPNSPLVGQRHCALVLRGWRAFVQDLCTAGGTFVNGQPVRVEAELRDGDRLRVGPLRFAVCLEVSAQEEGPAAAAPRARDQPGSDEECGVLLVPLDDGVAPVARMGG